MPATDESTDSGNGRITQAVRLATIEQGIRQILSNQDKLEATLNESLRQQHQRDITLGTLTTRVHTVECDVDGLKKQTAAWNIGNSLAAVFAGVLAWLRP